MLLFLNRYYVGVVDKKTKKIEKIESCLHCNLKPKLNIGNMLILECINFLIMVY